MTHLLKTWPQFFERMACRQKNFEVRKNDRDFQVGDTLILREYNPETDIYTGMQLHKTVEYILHGGNFGIETGYCIMSLNDSI